MSLTHFGCIMAWTSLKTRF